MNIFTIAFNPPRELISKNFCLFPTDEKLYQSDYIAVMNNRELLRYWSQSDWPEDEFTPQQNKEDLRLHVEDNKNHTAYGYMIYSVDKKTCYGSLYVNPLTLIPMNYKTNSEELAILKNHHVRLDYWVIEKEGDLEKNITEELKVWFETVWKISPLFSARKEMKKRLEVYRDLGFKQQVDLVSKNSVANLLLF